MGGAVNDKPWYRRGPDIKSAPRGAPPRTLHQIGAKDVPLRVFLRRGAWDAVAAGTDDPTVSRGGLLVGRALVDDEGPFVVVEGALPAAAAADAAAAAELWDELKEAARERFPGALVVGWFHSHPDAGAALSTYDRLVARRLFPEWWQLTYVIDPVRQRQAMYCWLDGELRSLPGFWIYEDVEDESERSIGTDADFETAAVPTPRVRGVGTAALAAACVLLALWSLAPLPGTVSWLQRKLDDYAAEARLLNEELTTLHLRHEALRRAVERAAAASTATIVSRPVQTFSHAAASAPAEPAHTFATAAEASPPGPVPWLDDGYVVRAGDTLWSISQELLGDPYAYRRVAEHNDIADPNLILPGWRLRLPPATDAAP